MRRRDGTRRVRPPVADVVHAAGYDPANPDQVFATIDSLRIPVEYMGNLITAGKADTVRTVLRKPAVVRAIMRAGQLGRSLDENLPASVGASVDDLEDLYRLLAIAKYEDRYVIPPAHAEDAGRLMGQHEQLFCSLDTDGGPDMGGTGPHGIQSYQPAVPPGENHSFRAGDGMVLDFAALAPAGKPCCAHTGPTSNCCGAPSNRRPHPMPMSSPPSAPSSPDEGVAEPVQGLDRLLAGRDR